MPHNDPCRLCGAHCEFGAHRKCIHRQAITACVQMQHTVTLRTSAGPAAQCKTIFTADFGNPSTHGGSSGLEFDGGTRKVRRAAASRVARLGVQAPPRALPRCLVALRVLLLWLRALPCHARRCMFDTICA